MDSPGWQEKISQFKIPIALSVLGLVLIAGGVVASGINRQKPKVFPQESIIENQKELSVDVSGAVNKPGVYKVKEGSRVEDAILQAGGLSQTANTDYISKYLNMAQKIADGSKIYVPVKGEQGAVDQSGIVAGANTQTKVNINTATQVELEALPGIATTRASNIISGRPYSSVEDLLSKKILPKSVFDKIKDQLVIY